MDNNPLKIDKSLLQAYERTNYVLPQLQEIIRIGGSHAWLDTLLGKENVGHWALITAFNPFSKVQSDKWNNEAQMLLKQYLAKEHYNFLEGSAQDPELEWPPEDNFLVLGITEEKAVAAGKLFNQNAIVFGEKSGVARLVFCL